MKALKHTLHFFKYSITVFIVHLLILSAGGDFHQSREITKMLLADGACVSLPTYMLTLQGHVPEHLSLILEYSGLPKGEQLEALVQAALNKVAHASFWLPLLLKAGLDPLLLLQQKM